MIKKRSGARAERIKTIILSLVLAVIAWAAIMWVDDPDIVTTISDLNIRFIGEADLRANGLVIIGKTDIPAMSASISGKRSDLMDYMDGVRIEADTSSITEAGKYTLSGTLSLPSPRLSIEKEKSFDIPITVEKLEEKEIEIKVRQTGTLKGKLVKSEISDNIVKISGAKSEIDSVSYGVATVDISEVREGMPEPSGYVLMDADDSLISRNETIETDTASVDIFHTVYELKTLPIEAELSEELSEQYVLRGAVVTPSGTDVGVLSRNTDESVKAVIYEVNESGEIEGTLAETDGMYIPEENKTVKIKAELDKIVTRPVELEIQYLNAPEGKSVTAESVSVTITGAESKLNSENIKATADLSGMGSGTHAVLVKIEGEDISAPDNCHTIVTIE